MIYQNKLADKLPILFMLMGLPGSGKSTIAYELCLKQNNYRNRIVSDYAISRMYLNWNPPSYDEGFDDIVIDYHYESDEDRDKYTYENFLTGEIGANFIDQENKHHTLTIGQHCIACGKYLRGHYDEDFILPLAGFMHDIGKVFTKSPLNSKGEIDDDYHYYQHHCVGAYDSFFYTDAMELSKFDKLRIANLIYYHMMPFTSWKQSPKAEQRCRAQIGEKMYEDIMKLHEADLAAH